MNDIVERLRVQIAAQTNCVTVKDSPSNAVVIIKQRDAIRAADEIERLHIEVANRAHSEQQYRAEIERLSDKALRFDLDQAGIEFREGIAVALVEAKAEIERALGSSQVPLRRDACLAIAEYGDKALYPLLQKASADGERTVRKAAAIAAKRLGNGG